MGRHLNSASMRMTFQRVPRMLCLQMIVAGLSAWMMYLNLAENATANRQIKGASVHSTYSPPFTIPAHVSPSAIPLNSPKSARTSRCRTRAIPRSIHTIHVRTGVCIESDLKPGIDHSLEVAILAVPAIAYTTTSVLKTDT